LCLKVGRIGEYIRVADKFFEWCELIKDKLGCDDTKIHENGIAHQDLEGFIFFQNKAHFKEFEEEVNGGNGKSHYKDRSTHH